jgi:precorrin-2 dehydrogenase/sirohydrochlorin ferrochelatase
MRYYPVNLDIKNKKCLVVGGGSVSSRKVDTLLKCGTKITVVSPEFSESLQKLGDKGTIIIKNKAYKSSDLEGMFLVIGATDNEQLNRKISADADKQNVLCNIADVPDASNFVLPAIVSRGDLTIAISTSGKSPAFAKKLRKDLEKEFGEEYEAFLDLMGTIRKKLLSEKHEPEAHKDLFENLISGGLLDMIKENESDRIDSLLFDVLGEGYTFKELKK